jgi:hypothetical protein
MPNRQVQRVCQISWRKAEKTTLFGEDTRGDSLEKGLAILSSTAGEEEAAKPSPCISGRRSYVRCQSTTFKNPKVQK